MASRRPDFLQGETFVVELDRFHGPLDLLLHLIRSQDIDVFDIPIARITRQFQAALGAGLDRLELDRAGEFLEMAATLVRIKAQLLLPRPGEPDWDEDPRADLVRRLLEYEHYHEVAKVLAASESERARHFPKGHVEPRDGDRTELLPELDTTREQFLEAVRSVPEPVPEPTHRAPVRQVTVEQKMTLLQRLFRRTRRLPFERLFRPWGTRPHAVASLMACLELGRQQLVRVEQASLFGEIWLFAGRRAEETEEGARIELPATGGDGGDAGPVEEAVADLEVAPATAEA